jgi:hypothetical protein
VNQEGAAVVGLPGSGFDAFETKADQGGVGLADGDGFHGDLVGSWLIGVEVG